MLAGQTWNETKTLPADRPGTFTLQMQQGSIVRGLLWAFGSRAVCEVGCLVDVFHFQRADAREVRPFGKELPQQSVKTFVRAAFPGMVRSGEIDVYLCTTCDGLMSGELFAVVEGGGVSQSER